jgi:class 3 adenylate cyclase/tetratricopeptide (TPR) repeat protein
MAVCAACGHDNPEGARFCNGCGSPLSSVATPPREERKVVSIVFADLVGSTSRAELLDPEDVRAVLSPYHDLLRRQLEAYGGTVEKFIGDAVVGVFGAPVAHEDDAERAVRASLAIQEAIADLNESEPGLGLEVRIGVNTGEALVDLRARPELGEAMVSGDVINTAARLQAAAPPGGVLVGEPTHRVSQRVIEFVDHEAIQARGKAEPVPCWLVVKARSSFGLEDDAVGHAPLVGRAREVALLADALARVRSDERPQLVTLVGVPGIGKSRLVQELRGMVDAEADLITWRRGRSLPYGEGISYWALGEIVKAQAGVLESDGADVAATKLTQAVTDRLSDRTETAWVERHLRPLVGLPVADTQPSRDEAFSAWRRFLEALAEQRPAVLVFEDLHWADDDLLDFIDELTDRVDAVPLLVVCTARPELLTRRPGWGGGKLNAVTLSLSPLSDEETARLLAALLGRSLLPAQTQAAMIERAEGVPLFAEEYARMLVAGAGGDELPDTLQGVVAARIDGLPPSAKALVQDAAVLGKVFWTDALGELTGLEDLALDDALRQLERREFVRRERRSAVEGARQYAFLHALVREVAYGQIPRATRSDKHRATAVWISGLATDRGDDVAETLVHHLESAIALGRAAGREVNDLSPALARALQDAGDRAQGLNAVTRAADYYRRAIEAAGEVSPELIYEHAKVRMLAEGVAGGSVLLEEAVPQLLEAGRPDLAAQSLVLLERIRWNSGIPEPELLDRALGLVADMGDSSARGRVLSAVAVRWAINGRGSASLPLAQDAVEIARAHRDPDAEAEALNNLSVAYSAIGDIAAALESGKAALALGLECGASDLPRIYVNVATFYSAVGDGVAVRAHHRDGLALCLRLGNVAAAEWLRAEIALDSFESGAWDESLADARSLLESHRAAGLSHYLDTNLLLIEVAITLARTGRLLRGHLEEALAQARSVGDPQMLLPTLAWVALLLEQAGDGSAADDCLEELLAAMRDNDVVTSLVDIWTVEAILAWLARRTDPAPDELFRGELDGPWRRCVTQLAGGSAVTAADIIRDVGYLSLEAEIRLHAARGGGPDALAQLDTASEFWRSVGAEARLAEVERVRASIAEAAS